MGFWVFGFLGFSMLVQLGSASRDPVLEHLLGPAEDTPCTPRPPHSELWAAANQCVDSAFAYAGRVV